MTHRPDIGAYDEEIKKMGGRIYYAPRLYPQNYLPYFKYMKRFFSDHLCYKIVHSHIDAMSAFPLLAALKNNIPVRIAHSHSSKLDRDIKLPIKYMALKAIPQIANNYCACGKAAGEFMFGCKPFQVINNAIDLEQFKFDYAVRKLKKQELGLEKRFVIGHVGRFCYIKNQLFILNIFCKILEQRPDSILLLVGKGEDEKKLRDRIVKLKLENKVIMLVDRPDVNKLYQAMDVFIMPSLFEGLPVVAVEAQANGLPCIVSDKISKEVLLTSNIKMLSLEKGADKWAEEINNINKDRNSQAKKQLQKNGYDVRLESTNLMNWYKELNG